MKILHVIFSLTTGGAETMLIDIVNEQVNKAEVNIIVINCDINYLLLEKVDNRVKVSLLNRRVGSRNIFPVIRLNKLILSLKCDVIHCHDDNIIRLLLPMFKKKTVLTIHDIGVNSNYFKQYSNLFSISKSVQDDLKKRTKLDSKLVYNGIDLNILEISTNLEINDTFKIIVVSRLRHFKKGQHLVIEALNYLQKKGFSNVIVDFIGSENIKGESLNYLKDLVKDYHLDKQISFLGHKDRDYVYAHLKDYNLLIQPSLFEGFGLTVAEGMAAKIPVLVSDIDGPMEIIENGNYGFCFVSGNIESLADKIEFIIANYKSEQINNLIEKAYLRVKSHFNIKQTARIYIEEYLKN